MKDFEKKNYYELLRVERDATEEEIKIAFKEIALVYHPDSNFFSEIVPDSSLTETDITLFKTLTSAYQTLSNKQKRAEYDAKLNKEELSKGINSTNEWIRPDGRAATVTVDKTVRKREPTQTDIQILQKRYQERSQHNLKTMADIMQEEITNKKSNNYLLILSSIFVLIALIIIAVIAL